VLKTSHLAGDFLYDGIVPVCEMNSSGTVTATNVFVGDGLVGRTGAANVYYVFDQQGNVAQRLNSSQSVTSSSTYDAYGAETSTGSPTDPFGYNAKWGYYFDREAGVYKCTFRDYDPSTGRWLTRDPLDYLGSINLYQSLSCRPMGISDPMGLKPLIGYAYDALDFLLGPPLITRLLPIKIPFPAERGDGPCRTGREPRPMLYGDTGRLIGCVDCLKYHNVDAAASFNSGNGNDKAIHFIAGCLARLRCGWACPNNIGSWKELADAALGGTVSKDDAVATDDGWDAADGFLQLTGGQFDINDIRFCIYEAKMSGWMPR
jgi:RHS repeat-associated protein